MHLYPVLSGPVYRSLLNMDCDRHGRLCRWWSHSISRGGSGLLSCGAGIFAIPPRRSIGPFTATGVVSGLAPNGTVLTRVDVFGAGTLTFLGDDLPPPSGFVSGYFYDASFEAPVPEPSTVILLMVGLGATAVRRHFA